MTPCVSKGQIRGCNVCNHPECISGDKPFIPASFESRSNDDEYGTEAEDRSEETYPTSFAEQGIQGRNPDGCAGEYGETCQKHHGAMNLGPFAEEDSGCEKKCKERDLGEHYKKESRVGHAEEEDGRGDLYRSNGNHRSGAGDGEANGHCTPAKPHMQTAVPNRDQQGLNEKEHKPGGDCEAVHCYERKNSGVDSSSGHACAVCVEGVEANQHEQEKDTRGGAVEIPISFHVGLLSEVSDGCEIVSSGSVSGLRGAMMGALKSTTGEVLHATEHVHGITCVRRFRLFGGN
jgi:hypothetical protein